MTVFRLLSSKVSLMAAVPSSLLNSAHLLLLRGAARVTSFFLFVFWGQKET